MKKWIEVIVVNTSNKISKIDPDSIISFGPAPGNTSQTQILTLGGHVIIVNDSTRAIEDQIKNT